MIPTTLLVVSAAAAPPPGPGAPAALWVEGERVGDVSVARVELHAEYQRYWLRLPDGTLAPAEVTTVSPGHEGLCGREGVDLFPRPELAEGPDGRPAPPPEGFAARVDPMCARLAEAPPALLAHGASGRQDSPGVTGDVPPPGEPGGGAWAGAWAALTRGLAAICGLGAVALVAAAARGAGGAGAGRSGRRDLALVLLVALGAHLAFAAPGIWNGNGAAYEKLRYAAGWTEGVPYGPGMAAVHAAPAALWERLGAGAVPLPERIFLQNGALSVLGALLLWALVRVDGAPDAEGARRARLAGLCFALVPTTLGMAATEAMHTTARVAWLASLLGAATWARVQVGWRVPTAAPGPLWARGPLRTRGLRLDPVALLGGLTWLAGAGLTAAIRPELLPAALAGLAWVLPAGGSPRWVGTALLAALLLPAALNLDLGQHVVEPSRAADPTLWLRALLPRLGPAEKDAAFVVFLHGAFTPWLLWPLAALGLARAPWGTRLRWLVLLGLADLPFWTKVWPLADAWRLQLPGQVPWLWMAAAGGAALAGWLGARLGGSGVLAGTGAPNATDASRATGAPVGATAPAWAGAVVEGALVLALVGWNLLHPPRPGWIHQREYAVLAEGAHTLPAGATVWVAGEPVRGEAMADVAGWLGAARWRVLPPGGDPRGPESFVWRGVGCLRVAEERAAAGASDGRVAGTETCEELAARCVLVPVRTERLGGPADLDLVVPADGVEVGWWRVEGCAAP